MNQQNNILSMIIKFILATTISCSILSVGFVVNAENNDSNPETYKEKQEDLIRPQFVAENSDSLSVNTEEDSSKNDLNSSALDFIREEFRKRNSKFTVTLPYKEGIKSLWIDIFQGGTEIHTGKPDEGDYMAWQYGTVSCRTTSDDSTVSFEYSVEYYTTLEQENAVTEAINTLKKELNIDNQSDYQIVKTVYEWIVDNVTYSKNFENIIIRTAYAALINRDAVCQGISTLFYRMMLEYGIDCRVVTSSDYSWNIVKLGNYYYIIDPSSAIKKGDKERYFLKGTKNYTDNELEYPYLTQEFQNQYPISENDYALSTTDSEPDYSYITDVNVSAKYYQEDARSLFEMINNLRQSDDAWIWNEDNSEKVILENLKPLNYDYDLERAAMTRAAELSFMMSQDRPNGKNYTTVFPDQYETQCKGENRASKISLATDILDFWSEAGNLYDKQENRRNLLSEEYSAIGLACIEVYGTKYWVAEFAEKALNEEYADYVEEEQSIQIEVNSRDLNIETTFQNAGLIWLNAGETVDIPDVTTSISYKDSNLFETEPQIQDFSSKETVATVSNGKIYGIAEGKTLIRRKVVKGKAVAETDLIVLVHEHNYELDHWNWAEDYSSAEAVLVCSKDTSHEYAIKANVTAYIITEATCEEVGRVVYTATVIIDETTYTDTKDVLIPATGVHEGTATYLWADDNSSVTAKLLCTKCGKEITETVNTNYEVVTAATCETDGQGVYTAEFETDGFDTQNKYVVIPALNHSYVCDSVVWGDDYESAQFHYVCENDPTHEFYLDAIVTIIEYTPPTCETDGFKHVEAVVTYDGKTSKVGAAFPIPAMGHEYELDHWNWNTEYTDAEAVFVCTHDATHTVTVKATISKTQINSSYVYVALVTFEDKTYTDIKAANRDNIPDSIQLDKESLDIRYGEMVQLHAVIEPEGLEQSVITWSSSDETIAAVNTSGKVTGLKPGKAVITAKTVNGLTASCVVRVLFTDVAIASQYFFDSVYWAVDNGITVGAGGAGKFSPDAACTREQIVTFLWRLMGQPEPDNYQTFTDVKSSDWYYKPISWAASKGITVGLNDGTGRFGVGQACTREQCVTFLYRTAGKPEVGEHQDFTDVEEGRYYYDSISWAASKGITVGLNDGTGRFGVGQKCTRAMIVTFLYRFATSDAHM